MKNKLNYWSRHKFLLLCLTTLTVLSVYNGFEFWIAWVFAALFIGLILALSSNLNPAYRAMNEPKKKEEAHKCMQCKRYKDDVLCGYCFDCWNKEDISNGGDQLLGGIS